MGRRGGRRRPQVVAAAGALVLVLLQVGPATAAPGGSYSGAAEARLVALDLTVSPPVLFDQLVDAGLGVAQAGIDSLGNSTALASTPYPGSGIVSLPGLLAALSQGRLSLPAYPLMATSTYPVRPSATITAGTVRLDASSSATRSSGSATDGAGQARATVGYDAERQTVTARAESSVPSLQLADGLVLHGLRSVAEATKGRDGTVRRTSTFELAALEVLGVRVAITPDELELLGTAVPLGPGLGELLAPLLVQLAAQGTTVEAVPALETPEGIRSAGLRVSRRLDAGPEAVLAQVTIGAVAAAASGQTFDDDLLPPATVGTDGVDVAVGGTRPGGALDLQDLSPDGPAPSDEGSDGPGSSVGPGRRVASTVPVTGLYPFLVGAGCLVVAVGRAFSRLGVRAA